MKSTCRIALKEASSVGTNDFVTMDFSPLHK